MICFSVSKLILSWFKTCLNHLESAILHAEAAPDCQYLGVVAACGEFLENEAAAQVQGESGSLGMSAFRIKESRANFHEK